jgi:hypothetical protein
MSVPNLTPVRYAVSETPAVPVTKFVVVDTSGKFTTGVVDTGGASTCEYPGEISKIFEMTLMLFSGAWGGKMICNLHEVALRSIKVRSALQFCCVLFSIY